MKTDILLFGGLLVTGAVATYDLTPDKTEADIRQDQSVHAGSIIVNPH